MKDRETGKGIRLSTSFYDSKPGIPTRRASGLNYKASVGTMEMQQDIFLINYYVIGVEGAANCFVNVTKPSKKKKKQQRDGDKV